MDRRMDGRREGGREGGRGGGKKEREKREVDAHIMLGILAFWYEYYSLCSLLFSMTVW